jgi:hypothetical protein
MLNQTRPAEKISGEQPANRSTEQGVWSSLFQFLMEGFALYGAAVHPGSAFHAEIFLTKAGTSESKSSLPAHPPSCPASPSDDCRPHRCNWLSPFW